MATGCTGCVPASMAVIGLPVLLGFGLNTIGVPVAVLLVVCTVAIVACIGLAVVAMGWVVPAAEDSRVGAVFRAVASRWPGSTVSETASPPLLRGVATIQVATLLAGLGLLLVIAGAGLILGPATYEANARSYAAAPACSGDPQPSCRYAAAMTFVSSAGSRGGAHTWTFRLADQNTIAVEAIGPIAESTPAEGSTPWVEVWGGEVTKLRADGGPLQETYPSTTASGGGVATAAGVIGLVIGALSLLSALLAALGARRRRRLQSPLPA